MHNKPLPLMHKGVNHGHVNSIDEDGNMDMSVHMDMTTGRLLEKPHMIVRMLGYYEIVLSEDISKDVE